MSGGAIRIQVAHAGLTVVGLLEVKMVRHCRLVIVL